MSFVTFKPSSDHDGAVISVAVGPRAVSSGTVSHSDCDVKGSD